MAALEATLEKMDSGNGKGASGRREGGGRKKAKASRA